MSGAHKIIRCGKKQKNIIHNQEKLKAIKSTMQKYKKYNVHSINI